MDIDALDEKLAQAFGEYAGYKTAVSPQRETYGDNPQGEVRRLLPNYVTPQSRVLDLGCGAGQTLCWLAPQISEGWGIDQEPKLLNGAEARAAHYKLQNITLIEANVAVPAELADIPHDYFDVVYTERGPNINETLMPTLKSGGFYLQELFAQYTGFHLREILGRKPLTTFPFINQAEHLVANLANLGLRPVSIRQFFYDDFFEDVDHLEAYLIQIPAHLSDWRVGPTVYDKAQDRAALELYCRYNQTPRGIRFLQHRFIYVGHKEPILYYPVASGELYG